jgi:hypothetical protein
MFTLFVFVCVYWCPARNVLCFCFVFLRLVYPMLSVSVNCPFLIVPSVFSNVYIRVHPRLLVWFVMLDLLLSV